MKILLKNITDKTPENNNFYYDNIIVLKYCTDEPFDESFDDCSYMGNILKQYIYEDFYLPNNKGKYFAVNLIIELFPYFHIMDEYNGLSILLEYKNEYCIISFSDYEFFYIVLLTENYENILRFLVDKINTTKFKISCNYAFILNILNMDNDKQYNMKEVMNFFIEDKKCPVFESLISPNIVDILFDTKY